MKKSAQVPLTLVTAVAAMLVPGCNRRQAFAGDPCDPGTFNQPACQEAVSSRGYYSHGTWIPHIYPYAFPYYYGNYQGYTSRGGRVQAAPYGAYARPGSGVSSSTTRGGFGSIGSGHAGGGTS